MTSNFKIQVSQPDISNLEKELVNKVLDSGWISSTGEFVDLFESLWASECNTKYALSVANGTVAIHLILDALNIGPGDEVIVPSLTFVSTANAVKYVGAKVVFADSNPETWCIDIKHVSNLITPNTKALIAVHLYGNPADMESLIALCKEKNIHLIEDAAEAPFATINSRRIGSIGIAASFSFYGNKILSSGEGGAITTNDEELYKRMKLLRGQGMDPNRRFFFTEIGYNYRLTNLQCSLLVAQINRKNEILAKRMEVFDFYDLYLKNHPYVEMQRVLPGHVNSPWLYTIKFQTGRFDTSKIAESLAINGIETRPIFIPIHLLPPYQKEAPMKLDSCEEISSNGLSLPTSSKLSLKDAGKVVESLLEVISI